MKKILITILLIFALITTVLAGVVLYTGNLAHITMTVKAPTINFFTIGISLGELDSLQSFDSGLYDPPGKEIAVRNITFSSVIVYTENLSAIEKAALYDCIIHVKIYNSTTSIIEGNIDALNETVLGANNLTGNWDVLVRITGQTGIPETEQPIVFDLVIDLDPDIKTGTPGNNALWFTTYDPESSIPSGVNPDTIKWYINGQEVPSTDLNIVQTGYHIYEANPIYNVYYNSTFDPGIYNTQFFVSDNAGNTRVNRTFFTFTPA